MDKIEPWADRRPDPCPGVSLYQMKKGNEENRWGMPLSMLMVAARVGRGIASAVPRKWMRVQI